MNVDTNYAANITVAIGTNPGGGTLSGTTTAAAGSGVASFSNLSINKSGVGYTLTATSGSLTSATSSTFTITPAAATQLKFTAQPTNTAATTSISPAVQVTAYDANMNVDTNYAANITVGISNNPGGGTLSGTKTLAASSGVASFSTLSIDKSGTGYTLLASSAALTTDTSAAFNITPKSATQLGFSVQPTNAAAGSAVSPAVQVTAYDANMNVDTSYSGNITVAISTNPGGGALSGTLTVAASSGVASFSTLSINKAGNGYTLSATATSLTSATSSAFNINPGTATQVKFTTQPSSTATAGSTLATQPTVTVEDAYGNTITSSTASITLAAYTGSSCTGAATGTFSVTANPLSASSGVAAFAGVKYTKAETIYIQATAAGLTSDCSTGVAVSPAAASQIVFTAQPVNSLVNVTMATVTTKVEDTYGNVVTAYSGQITLSKDASSPAGALSGTLSNVNVVNGVVNFTDLKINTAGNSFKLDASSSGVNGGSAFVSAAFNVNDVVPTKVVITQQPTNTVGCATMANVIATLEDASGNIATGIYATQNVSMAIGTNPPGNGVLSGTTKVAASGGAATFSTLSINKAANGYTLVASSSGCTNGTSSTFNIIGGSSINSLTFSTQPTNARPTSSIPSFVVTGIDSCGNTATGVAATTITLTLNTDPPGGTTITGATAATSSGVATFSSTSLNKSGIGFVFQASDGTHTVNSSALNVGIDLFVPIELLDAGISSSTTATTFMRTTTGWNIGNYDGILSVDAAAICQNTDSVAHTLTIFDQAGTSRCTLSIPASTASPTLLTSGSCSGSTQLVPSPASGITSVYLGLDASTLVNQVKCFSAHARIRQQYASKTQLYYPLLKNTYNYASNTDTILDAPYSNTGTAFVEGDNLGRVLISTSPIPGSANNTVISGYSFEGVISTSTGSAALILYDVTGATNVQNPSGTNISATTTSVTPVLVTSSSFTSPAVGAPTLAGREYEIGVIKGTGSPTVYLYKAGLWMTLTNLQAAEVLLRVGGYSSDTSTAVHTEVSGVYEGATTQGSSYYWGPAGAPTAYFEATGREGVAGTMSVGLYDNTLGSAVSGSSLSVTSTTKTRYRSSSISPATADLFSSQESITSGTLVDSDSFIVIDTK